MIEELNGFTAPAGTFCRVGQQVVARLTGGATKP
jgi:hypothetical protein